MKKNNSKIPDLIARNLLGLMFTVFGLNGFLHFIPLPPPTGVAGQFMGAMFVSHYLLPIFALQLAGGVLLLSNRYVPVALVFLGPIIVNILLYHIFMSLPTIAPALVALVLWAFVFNSVKGAFKSVLAMQTTEA